MSNGPQVSVGRAKHHSSGKTLLELAAVFLLGLATVMTAWCGFQAAQWNGEETDQARNSQTALIESSKEFTLGAQIVSYDANVTAQYAQAVADGNEKLQKFIRTNLARPGFLPILDEWEAKVRAGDDSAGNIFTNKAYIDEQFAKSKVAEAAARAAETLSGQASENADAYVLTTLLTAVALFFAGVTTSFATRPARLSLLAIATVVLAFVAARLVDLPIV